MKAGLKGVNFVRSSDPNFAFGHWAFRDASGKGLVVEFTSHIMQVYDDNNDGGVTGYGIMTNDPVFPVQLKITAAIQKLEHDQKPFFPWANKMPGGWDPVARFDRIFLLKSNMPKPKNGQEAIMQAIHTLNSISVPLSEGATGFYDGDRTQWSAVYDQKNRTVYWRTYNNQNM